tara:strand:+ start:53 stop:475 length:423 start_codon:yes stop_codon:yes gene_type:complete
MANQSWEVRPGLHNVGSYQVSGKPYASGSCLAPPSGSTHVLTVTFPAVTRWVQIVPHSSESADLKVGFSKTGLLNNLNSFHVNCSSSWNGPLEMKVSQLHFMSNDAATLKFDIVAGLTGIPIRAVETDAGPNWKGTDGVG